MAYRFVINPATRKMDIVSHTGAGSFGYGQHQDFEATAGQTVFTVTEFNLTDQYAVFVDGTRIKAGHSNSGNVVTFSSGQAEGTEIVICN